MDTQVSQIEQQRVESIIERTALRHSATDNVAMGARISANLWMANGTSAGRAVVRAMRLIKTWAKHQQPSPQVTARCLKYSINSDYPAGPRLFPFTRSGGSGTGVSK